MVHTPVPEKGGLLFNCQQQSKGDTFPCNANQLCIKCVLPYPLSLYFWGTCSLTLVNLLRSTLVGVVTLTSCPHPQPNRKQLLLLSGGLARPLGSSRLSIICPLSSNGWASLTEEARVTLQYIQAYMAGDCMFVTGRVLLGPGPIQPLKAELLKERLLVSQTSDFAHWK